MDVSACVQRSLNGSGFVPGLRINGKFCPIGPSCLSQTMAQRLANKRFMAVEAFVAVCARNAAG